MIEGTEIHGGAVHSVIVAYYPDQVAMQALLAQLVRQVSRVHIVDNTPKMTDFCASLEGYSEVIELTWMGGNKGIAAALNAGMRRAFDEGADYVLLSDQDSLPDAGMVATLVEEATRLKSKGVRVGCVCPAYLDLNTGLKHRFQVEHANRLFYTYEDPDETVSSQEIIVSITSGSLIPRDAFETVGPMDEEFFIDHVDSEWCLRARSLGFRNFGVARAVLTHRLGDGGISVWAGGWQKIPGYSPLRLYYRFRNFMLLAIKPHAPTLWLVRAARFWLLTAYAEIFFSTNRTRNARAIAVGLLDGLLGRKGPSRREF